MKKSEQWIINAQVMRALDEFNACNDEMVLEGRLRSCTAQVYRKGKYYVLQSYRTFIAFIDTETDTCYDVLRYVYGFTSTSAQHIAKFRRDYGAGKWGCEHELRYYAV